MLGMFESDEDLVLSYCPHGDEDCDIECVSCGHACADHHTYDEDSCLMCECDGYVDPKE